MTLFSSTPTFTQGLVLGQLSILLLLAFILRYLFFDTNPPPPSADEDESDHADAATHGGEPKGSGLPIPTHPLSQKDSFIEDFPVDATRQESLEWFNLLLNGVSLDLLSASEHGSRTTTNELLVPLSIRHRTANTNLSCSLARQSHWNGSE
jgi:hypothetical protein